MAAALILAARRRGPGLPRVLGALADSVAEDVAVRRKVEAERAKPRTTARAVTLITLGVVAVGALNGAYLRPYATLLGVSNFTVALLDEANKVASEPLVCNQVECHPYLDQDKVIAACRRHGMAMVAYSPIARGQAKADELLARIGEAHEQDRGAGLPALAHPAGHRGDPADQPGSSGWRRISTFWISTCPTPR